LAALIDGYHERPDEALDPPLRNGLGQRCDRREGHTLGPEFDAIFGQIRQWRDLGHGVALATVIRTWGSSPRPPGSHLAVDSTGRFVGSVSGGCVEAAVMHEAEAVIRDGRPRRLQLGVRDDQAWEVGLACGGRLEVYIERVEFSPDIFDRLMSAASARVAMALVTRLSDGRQALVESAGVCGDLELGGELMQAVRSSIRLERSGPLAQDEDFFVRVYAGPPRLLVVGAVHISEALAPMAALAGFDVTVIDPRRSWADGARFPNIALSTEWPEQAMARLAPDARTAVVTLTHDPKLDDPALVAALNSPAFYIGSLGSTRTHSSRVARLTELGLGDRVGRIHAPIGLDLGGRSPAEIAVATLAQIVLERYRSSES
jgi:xanthine dehydrogenase accessory factor